jgi:cell division cycle 14
VFSIDNVSPTQELVYEPFNKDFGPLSLSMVYRFCSQLERLLEDPRYRYQIIVHYCSDDPAKKANAAYLVGAFALLVHRRPAREIWSLFAISNRVLPFRDAGYDACTYKCTLLHCLRALERAVKLGWFALSTFNCREYEFLSKLENGDMNWIIPNKFLAFSSPSDAHSSSCSSLTPAQFVPLFKRIGVACVVRLNSVTYDADPFVRVGLKHSDLFFEDGSVPSDLIITQFMEIALSTQGAIAVHCKAGLGRTGTLIGCYAISMRLIGAKDYIAWARICRPGSILGPQQQFLVEFEARSAAAQKPTHCISSTYDERARAVYGDHGQGTRLMRAKRLNQSTSTTPVKQRPEQERRSKENSRLRNRGSESDLYSRIYLNKPEGGRVTGSHQRLHNSYSFVGRG